MNNTKKLASEGARGMSRGRRSIVGLRTKEEIEAAREGARAMAKARWAHVPKSERTRIMTEIGKLGGRPLSPHRCPCGQHTWERAQSRNFDCCRTAGVLTQ